MKNLSIVLLVSGLCAVGSAFASDQPIQLHSERIALLAGGAAAGAAYKFAGNKLAFLAAAAAPSALQAASEGPWFPTGNDHLAVVRRTLQSKKDGAPKQITGQDLATAKGTTFVRRAANLGVNAGLAGVTWFGLSKAFGSDKAAAAICMVTIAVGAGSAVKSSADEYNNDQLLLKIKE